MKKVMIDNRTSYRTDDLLRIANAVMREYHKTYTTPETLRLTCIYRRIRDGFCGGEGWYYSNRVTLKLSKDVDKVKSRGESDDQAMNIARTILHELAHCRGLRHGDMGEGGRDDHRYNVEYVREFPVREKAQPKAKPAPSIEDKLERLEARRKKVEARIKRAQNALRKVLKSIQYYQRRKAA